MSRVDARSLLTPLRLDYAVKWRFFRHLMTKADPDSERVYRWLIEKRTGGREIDYLTEATTKHSVDEYVVVCRELLASMMEHGFKKAGTVPIHENGLPLDGSHRISAALALGIKVRIKKVRQKPKRTWGFDWFVDQGMPAADLQRVVWDWCGLKDGA